MAVNVTKKRPEALAKNRNRNAQSEQPWQQVQPGNGKHGTKGGAESEICKRPNHV